MEKFPKLLILSSYNLMGNSATDITMRSIFNHWPKNNLLILTTNHTFDTYSQTIFINNAAPGKLRNLTLSVLFGKSKIKDNKNIVPGVILSSSENKTTLKSKLYSIGAAYTDMLFLPNILKKDMEAVKQFNPDFIYSPLGNIALLRLSRKISKQLNVPVIPHFMDDWPNIRYTGSLWFWFPRLFLLHSLKQMFKSVDIGCCISEKMCAEYQTRYHKRFIPIMNIITVSGIDDHEANSNKLKSEIYLTYLGGLHLNRWKTLLKLDNAIEVVNRNLNTKLRLLVYTSDHEKSKYSSLFSGNVCFKDQIDHTQVSLAMAQSDYLVHIESFDLDVFKFIEFSISTKIPEYLASARPIIAIGPGNVASIEYLVDNHCSYVASENSIEEIERVLLRVVSRSSDQLFLDNANHLVQRNHTTQQIHQLLCLLEGNAEYSGRTKPLSPD